MTYRQIDFITREPAYYTFGRNGIARAKGLALTITKSNDLVIENINSKGQITRAAIVAPAELIPDLIAALQELTP